MMCRIVRNLAAAFVALVLTPAGVPSCSSSEPQATSDRPAPESAGERARPKIVVLGDSLTSGYGLSLDQSYPALLQERLDRGGFAFDVVNAGVSGDTSAGALRRLNWVLEGDVRVLIVALGGNDGLRGLSIEGMRQNLTAIITTAKQMRIQVLLAGMEAPPNMGEAYAAGFRQAFRDLALEHDVVFLPFLLAGVAGVESLNQADGIHPNAGGQRILAENLWPYLKPMLEPALTR